MNADMKPGYCGQERGEGGMGTAVHLHQYRETGTDPWEA